MQRCKKCKYWSEGECRGVDLRGVWVFRGKIDPATQFTLDVEVDDDSGLIASLSTGPDFGCVRFEEAIRNKR